jgi:hypothetical protein
MARKLELRSVTIGDDILDETGKQAILDYGRMIDTILRRAPPQTGLTLDEVTKAMEALAPVTAALRGAEDHVVLTDDQWATLCAKLSEFPFGLASESIVEFGRMIRNAPEIGTEMPAPAGEAGRPRRVS